MLLLLLLAAAATAAAALAIVVRVVDGALAVHGNEASAGCADIHTCSRRSASFALRSSARRVLRSAATLSSSADSDCFSAISVRCRATSCARHEDSRPQQHTGRSIRRGSESRSTS
jgi:hypothetical protein